MTSLADNSRIPKDRISLELPAAVECRLPRRAISLFNSIMTRFADALAIAETRVAIKKFLVLTLLLKVTTLRPTREGFDNRLPSRNFSIIMRAAGPAITSVKQDFVWKNESPRRKDAGETMIWTMGGGVYRQGGLYP